TVAAERRLRRRDQAADVLLLLLTAGELAHVLALLDHALVADRYRTEVDLARPPSAVGRAEHGVDDDREQPELRRQQLASTRSRALEEELERPAVEHAPAHVGVDDRGVESVAAETATYEEGPAAPKDRAERKEGQVVARSHQWDGHVRVHEKPREDDV